MSVGEVGLVLGVFAFCLWVIWESRDDRMDGGHPA